MTIPPDPLDELLAENALLKQLTLPIWLFTGVAALGLLGLMLKSPGVGFVGWIGPWLIGPWVISRAAAALRMPALVKYPLFLSCAVPMLSFIPPVVLGVQVRGRLGALDAEIRQAQARERRRPSAPATAPSPSAPGQEGTRAPVSAVLPIVRGASPVPLREGEALKLEVVPGQVPAELLAQAELPPTRACNDIFIVGYHVDAGSHWVSVGAREMQQAGLNLNGLHRQAVANLLALTRGSPGLRTVNNGSYHGFVLDGDHESCLVLLDGIWNALAQDMTPNGVVVAIPSRDVLAFCDAHSTEGIAALREAVRRLGPDAPGALLQDLLIRRDGRWSILN